MRAKIEELEITLNQVGDLSEILKAFKELAAERRTEVSELLQSYRPEAGNVSEERESIERVVELLRRIEDDWPLPGAEDLRTYLRRLREFAEQSHADRLRMRLAQIFGLSVISKDIVLDPDDVVEIQDNWPLLSKDFAEAYLEPLGIAPPSSSDKLVVWIREASQKQALLAALPLDERLAALDAKTRAWATRVVVRPSQVEEAINSRGRVLQLLSNLSRSVGPSVINEVIMLGERAQPGESHSVLEREAQVLQDAVERLAARLNEIAGGVRRQFSGETCAAILAELDVARRSAEESRTELHKRILSLGRVVEQLGGRAAPIPSPLSVPEAQRLAKAEFEAAITLLTKAWHRVTERLRNVGINPQLAQRTRGATPENDLSCLEAASDWCNLVEKDVSALIAMGAQIPELVAETREAVLQDLRAEVGRWQKQLEDVNESVRLIRLRLLRLGCPGVDDKPPFVDIKDAKAEFERLTTELDGARGERLREASEHAQGAYKMLLSDDVPDPVAAAFRELRDLGLIRTIEDDL
jgi:hypothetical protein